MWDLIVSVPEHCLSFYFTCMFATILTLLQELSCSHILSNLFEFFFVQRQKAHNIR